MKILDTKKKEYYIYALLTRTNDLFYIGKTKNHPNERIKQHFYRQTNKEMSDQFYWFRKYNEMPYYFIIEQNLTEFQAFLLEQFWIEVMQKANIQILNKVIPVIRKQHGSHRIKIQASYFNVQDIIKGKIKAVVNHKYCYSFQERKKGAHAEMFS